MKNTIVQVLTTRRPGRSKIANGLINAGIGAGNGVLTPLRCILGAGKLTGSAFGRVISLPLGMAQKGYMEVADKFRSPFMKPEVESCSEYVARMSERIVAPCANIGIVAGWISIPMYFLPLCLACAPVTALVGGAAGFIGGYYSQPPQDSLDHDKVASGVNTDISGQELEELKKQYPLLAYKIKPD